jgi:paired amphipathic helix protein Sin3a
VRNLRSKSLLNEIETLYDERHEQEESNGGAANEQPQVGPHQTLEYHDPAILIDANNLLIHHVKRQTSIHKDDKHKVKVMLRHFILDLFKHHRQELSDDERDDEEDEDKEDPADDNSSDKEGDKDKNGSKSTRSERARKKKEDKKEKDAKGGGGGKKENAAITEADVKVEANKDGRRTPLHARDMEADESYSHIMCNNNWYLFFRLHNILCERLTKMYNQSLVIRDEEARNRKDRKESTAVALRLKPKSKC